MSSWWNSTGASNFTRGLTSITGQLSNNFKEILTEASEETYDPNAELTRARQQIDELELNKQTLIEECTSLKKQCDELIIEKQSVEIKSEMLLAESRRIIEEKDNELKRLRNSGSSWTNTNDPNNTWTDILEDDQPEISEYLKYQRTIREFKEENTHLRDEMSNLRKTIKSQQAEKKQSRQDDDLHQMYSEQITKLRQEYEDQLQKLRSRIEELEQWNANQQEEELRKSIEVQKDVDDLDKDLLSQELEQANTKLNWYNDKFKDYSDLSLQKQQLENDLQIQQQTISQLRLQIEQFNSIQQHNQINEEEFNRLLNEERQRCDALANDNDSLLRLLDELRKQHENQFNEELNQKNQDIQQLNSQIDSLQKQIQIKEKQFEDEKNDLLSQLNKQNEDENIRQKESHQRELLEKQIIDLNEDLQTLENEKTFLNEQIDQLKEQLQFKDRQIQSIQNSEIIPGSPAAISSSPNTRTRSPSPSTFEHLLDLEAQILRYEEQFQQLNSIYNRFLTLLPIDIPSIDNEQISLIEQFTNLFQQWSTYVDTLSITQQESDSLRQLLIEKQDDLEKLQIDLDLTTSKLIEFQQTSINRSSEDNNNNDDELEQILELHSFSPRAPSRQSLISSTPGEKQQLIAQNELLSSLLAEKDRELILLQQAEKTREDLRKNYENLKANCQQIEIDRERKQNELNEIKNVLDEKIRENSSLKKEKMYFIEKLADFERNRQEQQAIIQISPKQLTQDDDKPSSPTTKQSSNFDEIHTKEEYEKLRSEYDQLVEFSKRQHDESLSYYNEYTRILGLHNDLNSKYSQLQIDYESLQSLIQQKNEGILQCQNELNNYQNLLYHEKKKSDENEHLRSLLIERENKLQELIDNETKFLVKQSELERELKFLEQNNFELKSSEQSLIEQLEKLNNQQIQENNQHLENDLEITKQKIVQYEEREKKLTNELERLRTHLLKMEESYTNDLLIAEDREKLLRNQIAQLDDTNKGQYELIQQLNTLGEQSKQTLATELAALKFEYSKLETNNQNLNNQLQYQLKCSQNLQNVLEQFKREREQHINEHLRQYQDALREQTSIVTRLTTENNEIRTRLSEFNEAISAAQRLNDQLEKKDLLINTLRNDLVIRDKQIKQYEENLRDLQSTSGSRVEKQLVKNILLSYFHTPVDKRQEVVPLLGALVGFTQEEYRNAINALSNNNSNQQRGATGWLGGWLGGNQTQTNLARTRTQSETPAYDPNKSFTELLIQYVDQQSTNTTQQPTAKFNTDEYLHRYDSTLSGNHSARKPSLSASANPFVNTTHLSLNKPPTALVLPTMNNPPPPSTTTTTTATNNSETSSTFLKDLLKN